MQQEMGNGSAECQQMVMMMGGGGGKRQYDGLDQYGLDEMGADMELSSMMNQMGERESSSNSGGDGMEGGGGGCPQ